MARTLRIVIGIWVIVLSVTAVTVLATPYQVRWYQGVVARTAPAATIARAQYYLDALADGHDDVVAARLAPTFSAADLAKASSDFPAGRRESSTVIGSTVNVGNGVTAYNISFEEHYPHTWLATYLNFTDDGTGLVIYSGGAHHIRQPLEDENAFTFAGKSVGQLLFLMLALGVATFIVITLTVATFTPIAKHKWLWLLFIAVGIPNLQMDWTTGQTDYQLGVLTLLGAGIMRASPYSPWILTIALPIGAVVFWMRRSALAAERERDITLGAVPGPV